VTRKDAKPVSIVALAAFHPNTKVQSAAIHFFLGAETDADDGDSSEDEDDGIRSARRDVRSMEHRMKVGKSGKKKERMLKQVKSGENKVSANCCE
jgi:protein SDA1